MKYLNFILGVIAFCLLIITSNILGLIPKATSAPSHFVNVPINSDGSINVRFVKGETMDVNIDEIGGLGQSGKTLDVNLDEIDNSTPDYPLHVEVER